MKTPTHGKKIFVTGGAGFIGSNVVDRLLEEGHRVTAYDNFSTGSNLFLTNAGKNPQFRAISGDLLDFDLLRTQMSEAEIIYHLAAHADVRYGTANPRRDIEQNTLGTLNVLEAMRELGIKKLVFSSTGSIYGDATVIPTPEDAALPIQTSLYGASKLACEGLIQAYCEGFGFQSWIFRLVGILGERYTHGHVFDFCKNLLNDPSKLLVLGDGKQKKSYLYVQDCINAMFCAVSKSQEKVNIFNLGTDEYCEVSDCIRWITSSLNVNPEIVYKGGDRGWVGDSPFIYLDTKKIRSLGWKANLSIEQSIKITADYLLKNQSVLARL